MFADVALASRIDAAEGRLVAAIAGTLRGRGAAVDVTPLGGGVSVVASAGSPINKIIGLGLGAPLDDDALGAIEAAWWARGETVRIEIASLADPALHARLAARGYRLHGFEHVLVRRLVDLPAPDPAVRLDRVGPDLAERWLEVALAGWAAPDGTGADPDDFGQEALAAVFRDFVRTEAIEHFIAYLGDAAAGSAGLRLDPDRLALLAGASTVPALRRRGVQRAMLAGRLALAAAAGYELAVVATMPGSQSQANVMRAGFAIAYARAILMRPPPG